MHAGTHLRSSGTPLSSSTPGRPARCRRCSRPARTGPSRTLAGVAGTVALKVRELDADTGAAIEGDTIAFTLPDIANAHWSAGVSRKATVKTGAGGKAQAFLVTSQAAEGPWRVVVESAAAD